MAASEVDLACLGGVWKVSGRYSEGIWKCLSLKCASVKVCKCASIQCASIQVCRKNSYQSFKTWVCKYTVKIFILDSLWIEGGI